jgi:hypothetical protein
MIDQEGINSLNTGAEPITYEGTEGQKSPEQDQAMALGIPEGLTVEEAIETFKASEGRDPNNIEEVIEFFQNRTLSGGQPLPEDPTKPINPFGPKPIGPVLPDRQMAAFGGIMGLDNRKQYGIGSKFKRAISKITRPFTKVAQKLMPKELAGIARMGAPFLAASGIPYAALYGGALSAAGQAKQSGKVGLLETLMAASPGLRFQGGAGPSQFKITGVGGETGAGRNTLRDLFLRGEDMGFSERVEGYRKRSGKDPFTDAQMDGYRTRSGKDPIFGKYGKSADEFLFGAPTVPGSDLIDPSATAAAGKNVPMIPEVKATKGLLGSGGDYGILGLGEADSSQLADVLIGGKGGLDKGGVNKLKLGSWAIGIVSGIQAGKYKDEQDAADAAEAAALAADSEASEATLQAARDWAVSTFGKMSVYADGGRINKNMGGEFNMPPAGLSSLQTQQSDVTPQGMELDLRGGGFIPIGKAEKADDVPARVSKNEFVFTADAVKAAGGGSVNEGAKRMYDTMKRLESQVG